MSDDFRERKTFDLAILHEQKIGLFGPSNMILKILGLSILMCILVYAIFLKKKKSKYNSIKMHLAGILFVLSF